MDRPPPDYCIEEGISGDLIYTDAGTEATEAATRPGSPV